MAKFHSILKVKVAEIFKRKTPNESAMITLHCKVYSDRTATKHVDKNDFIGNHPVSERRNRNMKKIPSSWGENLLHLSANKFYKNCIIINSLISSVDWMTG